MFTLSFSHKHDKSPMAYFSFSFPTKLSGVRYRMAETMICTSTLDVKRNLAIWWYVGGKTCKTITCMNKYIDNDSPLNADGFRKSKGGRTITTKQQTREKKRVRLGKSTETQLSYPIGKLSYYVYDMPQDRA